MTVRKSAFQRESFQSSFQIAIKCVAPALRAVWSPSNLQPPTNLGYNFANYTRHPRASSASLPLFHDGKEHRLQTKTTLPSTL